MLNSHINTDSDITDSSEERLKLPEGRGPDHDKSDPVTSPVKQLQETIGRLPFFLLIPTIMIISYLVILATSLKEQLGNSFGWFIGAAGMTAVILWLLGWLMVLKNRQGLSGQGLFLQVVGGGAGIALLIVLGLGAGWIGILVGLIVLGIAVIVLKSMSFKMVSDQTQHSPTPSSQDAPGTILIRNILNQLISQAEDPSTNPYKRMFYSNKQLTEEMKSAVDLQKQRVRYAYYVSEQVRMTAQKSLGYLLEKELVFPAVYKELFGREFQDIGNVSFQDMFDEFGRVRNETERE